MEDSYKNILVPVDGSINSNRALAEAVLIGKRNSASLDVIYVSDKLGFSNHITVIEQAVHRERELSVDVLRNAKRQLSKDIEAEFHLMYGNPKEAIVKFAEKDNNDLIVVSASGMNAITQTLIGSTTAYVVNHAPCNVLVVR